MCSATQKGLRVRRSKQEVVLRVVLRSLIGPGKPYWKTPFGLTGGIRSFKVDGRVERFEGEVVEDDGGVDVGMGPFLSGLEEKIAAVVAAPAAAEMPAIIARVVFDILAFVTLERYQTGGVAASPL